MTVVCELGGTSLGSWDRSSDFDFADQVSPELASVEFTVSNLGSGFDSWSDQTTAATSNFFAPRTTDQKTNFDAAEDILFGEKQPNFFETPHDAIKYSLFDSGHFITRASSIAESVARSISTELPLSGLSLNKYSANLGAGFHSWWDQTTAATSNFLAPRTTDQNTNFDAAEDTLFGGKQPNFFEAPLDAIEYSLFDSAKFFVKTSLLAAPLVRSISTALPLSGLSLNTYSAKLVAEKVQTTIKFELSQNTTNAASSSIDSLLSSGFDALVSSLKSKSGAVLEGMTLPAITRCSEAILKPIVDKFGYKLDSAIPFLGMKPISAPGEIAELGGDIIKAIGLKISPK